MDGKACGNHIHDNQDNNQFSDVDLVFLFLLHGQHYIIAILKIGLRRKQASNTAAFHYSAYGRLILRVFQFLSLIALMMTGTSVLGLQSADGQSNPNVL